MIYGFTVTPGDIEKNLKYASVYNFRVMEINLPAIIPFELMFHESKINLLRKFSEEHLLSYAFNIPFSLNIGDLFPEIRERALNYLTQCFNFASKINASYINMHFGKFRWFPYEDVMRRRKIDRFAEYIEPVLELAEKKNITLTLENLYPAKPHEEFYNLGDNYYDYEYLFEQVDSPNLKICLNAGHANLAEGAEIFLEKLPRKIHSFHICDNGGDEDDHLVPGEGTINWNSLLTRMNDHNFKGPFVAECPDTEPHEVIKKFELLYVESKMRFTKAV